MKTVNPTETVNYIWQTAQEAMAALVNGDTIYACELAGLARGAYLACDVYGLLTGVERERAERGYHYADVVSCMAKRHPGLVTLYLQLAGG